MATPQSNETWKVAQALRLLLASAMTVRMMIDNGHYIEAREALDRAIAVAQRSIAK